MKKCELTILMPCLNEARTIQECIRKAQQFLGKFQIQGEILVVDNGSTDDSGEFARQAGARVITVNERGYGNALKKGSEEARGTYVIMGDADDSYDFTELMPILTKLRGGCDLVIGNRFLGGIERGAMPFWHRYFGNPLLSFLGRMLCPCRIKDFHCGLRGYRKRKILELDLKSEGMEYASEMIVQAARACYRIEEVPVSLKKDGREGPSHLRSIRDGLRHIEILLRFRPVFSVIITFILTCMLCGGLLAVSSMIPQKAIYKNIEESADYFTEHSLFEERIEEHSFTKVDNYADCILTNIIYCMDFEHPVSGMIKASYYGMPTENVNVSLQKIINGAAEEPNIDYFRYWHGSMVFLRPMFTVFSIEEIRMILGICLLGLYTWLMIRLCRKHFFGPAGILMIGMLGVHGWMTAFCLEYLMTFLVMAGVLQGVAVKELRKNLTKEERQSFYSRLFVLSGMLTCFVDFLTAETLTFTVPLLLCYMMRFQKRELAAWKQELYFVIKCGVSWGCAYAMMFVVKWGLACMQLGTNAFREAWADASVRIGGAVDPGNADVNSVIGTVRQFGDIISRNVSMLFPFSITEKAAVIVFGAVLIFATAIAIWQIRKNRQSEKGFLIPVILIGCVPYVRYLFLRNHSYLHYFFTYRAQMAVLIAAAALLWAAFRRDKNYLS